MCVVCMHVRVFMCGCASLCLLLIFCSGSVRLIALLKSLFYARLRSFTFVFIHVSGPPYMYVNGKFTLVVVKQLVWLKADICCLKNC